jgi:glycosyltransferase involved in cell wall biosynthesis
VVRLLKNPALCERMGAAGRVRAGQFGWPAIAARVEALYSELIDRYPNPRLGR